MWYTNYTAVILSIALFILFLTFGFLIASQIEGFQDTTLSLSKETEVKGLVEKITMRMCPIQNKVQSEIAKGIDDSMTQIPSTNQLKKAMTRMVGEAQGFLFPCTKDGSINVYSLGPTSFKEIALSLAFLYPKLVEVNTQMTRALKADFMTEDEIREAKDKNDEYDAKGQKLEEFSKRVLTAIGGRSPSTTITSSQAEMNPSEKEAFLQARFQEFTDLWNRRNTSSGESEVESLLKSIEEQKKQLDKIQTDAQKGTLKPDIAESGPASPFTSSPAYAS
jgi:hypothetical protein